MPELLQRRLTAPKVRSVFDLVGNTPLLRLSRIAREVESVEIYRQTGGHLTHFVATLGTSGTFVGTGRRLREYDPAIELISVQPDSSFHGLEGMKHIASSIVPVIYDPGLADRDWAVSTEEAQEMVKLLARREGLLVGISSGAAMAACLRLAREIHWGVIVTLFPDGGDKYLSARFWEE